MLVVEEFDVILIEVAALARALVEKDVADIIAQLLIYPFLNRQTKSLLGSVQYLVRHEAPHSPLENVLGLKAIHLQLGWNARDELNQLVIQKGHARLQ